MISVKKTIASGLLPCLLLVGCGNSATDEEVEVMASGAKSAVATLEKLITQAVKSNRPGATLGIYVGLYVSQGMILPTQGAVLGLDAMARFIEAQSRSDTDENFALLREVGSVLQVDLVDTLNRSPTRAKTLDEYTQSLRNVIVLTERKIQELEILHDRQRDTTREKRNEVRDLERNLRNVLRDQDYAQASDLEQQLAKANSEFAEMETKTEQTGDMLDRFEELLEIAQERLQAVTVNREILIAGLRVIEVPGISDLNILEKGSRWSRRGTRDIFN